MIGLDTPGDMLWTKHDTRVHIGDLEERHLWHVNADEVVHRIEHWANGELVKASAHVLMLTGAEVGATAGAIDG